MGAQYSIFRSPSLPLSIRAAVVLAFYLCVFIFGRTRALYDIVLLLLRAVRTLQWALIIYSAVRALIPSNRL